MGETAPDAWPVLRPLSTSFMENVGCQNRPTETLGQILGSRRSSRVSRPTPEVQHMPNGAEQRRFRPGSLLNKGNVVPNKEKWWCRETGANQSPLEIPALQGKYREYS